MSDIYDKLLDLYGRCPERNMGADMAHYLRNGYVFSSPTYLLIGERIADGWHIHVAIGKGCFEKFCELMPYWLPYVGWAREHKPGRHGVRWHRTEDVFKKVGYHGRIITETAATTRSPEPPICHSGSESGSRWEAETKWIPIHHPWGSEQCAAKPA